MCKLGLEDKALRKSIAKELGTAYLLPFLLMMVSAYYSVLALGNMMHTDLFRIYGLSVFVVLVIFALYYCLSIVVYQKNVGMG